MKKILSRLKKDRLSTVNRDILRKKDFQIKAVADATGKSLETVLSMKF